MQDIQFDKDEQLKSLPVLIGKSNAIYLSVFLHLVVAILILIAGISSVFSWIYWVGAGIFIALLIYQHLIVKPDDLSRVNMAFFTTNGIASLIFSLFTIGSLYL